MFTQFDVAVGSQSAPEWLCNFDPKKMATICENWPDVLSNENVCSAIFPTSQQPRPQTRVKQGLQSQCTLHDPFISSRYILPFYSKCVLHSIKSYIQKHMKLPNWLIKVTNDWLTAVLDIFNASNTLITAVCGRSKRRRLQGRLHFSLYHQVLSRNIWVMLFF